MTELHLILGHGSREARANAEFEAWVDAYRRRFGDTPVSHAYVELAQPSLEEALDRAAREHARVLVVPAVMFAASHVKNDVPIALSRARAAHPHVQLAAARPFGVDVRLVDLIAARANSLMRAGEEASTAIVIVARGSSDPDANGDFVKLVRLYAEGRPYARVEPCFAGVTGPSLEQTLEWLARARPTRIVVVPYLLFSGRILDQLQQKLARFAEAYPWIGTAMAPHLGIADAVLDVAHDRAREALTGAAPLPCDTCQFRVPVGAISQQVGGLRSLLWSVRHMTTHTQAMPHAHAHAAFTKHVLVCTNADCADRGSVALVGALRRELKQLGHERVVRVTRTSCMGRCGEGPTVAVYPDGIWYRGVREGDAAELAREHLVHDRIVGRLVDSILQ
jgi:sirohydrochlorin ferrochelatase/(2Fe-2S) ferredoxin